MVAKQIGQKQKSKQLANDDIYDFQYKYENALYLLQRAKISDYDRGKVFEFVELLKALRVSKGRIAKYILQLKICENLGCTFEAVS